MVEFVKILIWAAYFVSLYFTVYWFVVFIEYKDTIKKDKKQKLRKFPIVTVVVPAFNEEKHIAKTLASLLNLDYPTNKLEVIVVNDGSTDRTREKVEAILGSNSNLKLINQRNKGKAAALNKGLREASGEFFVCMDADSVIERAALRNILPHFNDPEVGLVLPMMKANKPRTVLQKMQYIEYLINYFLKRLLGCLDSIHVGPGPFSVYRMSVIRKLGGYEVGNITEDLELTLRLQKRGYKVIQTSDTKVYTETPENLRAYYPQRSRWYKGGVLNGLKYKDVMFNPKYGDFGLIQAPVLLVSGILALTIVFANAYNLLRPRIEYLLNLRLVSFDIITYILNYKVNFNLLDLSYPNVLIFLVMLSFSLCLLYFSHKYTKEQLNKNGIGVVGLFVFFYFLLLGMVWVGVFKDFLTRRGFKWSK